MAALSLRKFNDRNILPFSRRDETTAYIECLDNLTFMRKLENDSMNLIVTSPPYNIGKVYEKRTSNDIYIEQQAAAIAEAVRVLHPNGSICWQVGNGIEDGEVFPLDILLYPIFKNHGLKLRNRIVWTFGHGLHCQKRLSGRHETILWFTKGDDYTFNLDPIRVPSKYPNKKHFKGPKEGKYPGIRLVKTRRMSGTFQTSKPITLRKQIIHVNFP